MFPSIGMRIKGLIAGFYANQSKINNMKSSSITFFMLLLLVSSSFSQVKLPDITKLDSVRIVKKKVNAQDTIRKVQFIAVECSSGGCDTIRGSFQDSLSLAIAVREKINQENSLASDNTFRLYQQFSKAKGVSEYSKLYKRITGQNYTDYTWSTMKAPYLGQWQFSGQGVTSHILTVGEDAKAIRDTGTPKYSGRIEILAQTRIQLVNYLANNTTIVFDFVARNEFTQGGQRFTQEVFMSSDGKYFIVK